jgi:hypothetical protein
LASNVQLTAAQLARLEAQSFAAPAGVVGGSPSTATAQAEESVFPQVAKFGAMPVESLERLRIQAAAYLNEIDVELRNRSLCIICLNSPKMIIFYPCKHKCTCKQCSDLISECPICRTAIVDKFSPFDA